MLLYSLFPLSLITVDLRFTWSLMLLPHIWSFVLLIPMPPPPSWLRSWQVTNHVPLPFSSVLSCVSGHSVTLLLSTLLVNSCIYILVWCSSDRTVPTTNICNCIALVVGRDSFCLRKMVFKICVKSLDSFLG